MELESIRFQFSLFNILENLKLSLHFVKCPNIFQKYQNKTRISKILILIWKLYHQLYQL